MQLVSVFPAAENVVAFTFDVPPYYTGLFNQFDAANPALYTITPVNGSIGADGNPCRPVSPVSVALSTTNPNVLLVTLNECMSPFPAFYDAEVTGLVGAGGASVPIGEEGTSFILGGDSSEALAPDPSYGSFFGCYRILVPPQVDAASPTRDIANPDNASALQGSIATGYVAASAKSLGTFVYGADGDYGINQGVISYKKRIIRRGICRPGGMKHAVNYGVGIPSYAKKLASPSLRQKLAADWESQIKYEPETATVTVTPKTDPSTPGLCYFIVQAQMKNGATVNFGMPVSMT